MVCELCLNVSVIKSKEGGREEGREGGRKGEKEGHKIQPGKNISGKLLHIYVMTLFGLACFFALCFSD